MSAAAHFAADYRDARARFLSGCREAGAAVESFENPARAPDGEPVHTDIALLGRASSPALLLGNSATHGVEGFCGAGCMTAWLHTAQPRELPDGVAVVLVHAINPHGFAWLRRVNEDNVDLNRNFIDHDAAAPDNAGYDALHEYVLPERFDTETLAACDAALMAYAAEHGMDALQAVLSRGQYGHADGLFYGGRAATWSNRTFRAILAAHAPGRRHVAFIDFHTGLGPYGHGELISKQPVESDEYRRLVDWYGPAVRSSASGDSASPDLDGIISNAVRAAAPQATLSSITAEFGTYPLPQVLSVLREDNWIHARGRADGPQTQAAKARIRETFYPADPDWRELVGLRGMQLIRRTVTALAASL